MAACPECDQPDGWHTIGCTIELKILDAWVQKERQSRDTGVCAWCAEKMEDRPTKECRNPSIHTWYKEKK